MPVTLRDMAAHDLPVFLDRTRGEFVRSAPTGAVAVSGARP
ncbi:hypothetical protein [Isoptericola sp. BMS4]|nr:hypothetical protein [Isoptericola sp. BMS4]